MNPQIDVSNIVPVSINIAPTAVPYSNFGTLLILGDSDRIDGVERIRQYASIEGVAADFSQNDPEYLAALPYFGQEPKPAVLFIGSWVSSDAPGLLHGGILTSSEQIVSNFTAITSGSIRISVDGVSHDFTGINFSTALNLNGVASILQTALRTSFTGATVTWSASEGRFTIASGTDGVGSSVSYASTASSGTAIASLLKLTSALASTPVVGRDAETLLDAAQAMADVSPAWYGLTVASAADVSDDDHMDVAAFILASSRSRRYGITITSSTCLDSTATTDLASKVHALGNKRVFWQYSSTNPYAVTSFFGRAATVNFEASKAAITLMFKQEPGVAAENLTETQFATLKAKGGNAFVKLNNGASIIMPGQNSDGTFFDEVHNLDWLKNALQTDVFNLMYQTPTKIPQTDDGAHQVVTTIEATCEKAVYNGVAAPGVWNAAGFGQLRRGDTLTKGYYVFCPPMALQSQAERETRRLPPMQIAIKMAGAVHDAPIIVNVNR